MHARPGLKSLVPRYVHTYVQYVNCEVRMYVCTNNEELLKSYTLNNHTHLHPPQAPCTYTHYRPHPLTHTTGPTHLHTLQDLPTYAHYRPNPPAHTTGPIAPPTHLQQLGHKSEVLRCLNVAVVSSVLSLLLRNICNVMGGSPH